MAQRIDFGSLHISVDQLGERGSPVVLLHSTGMTSRQWKRLAERLAPTHRVFLPDLLGYGASSSWPRDRPFHFSLDVVGLESLIDSIDEPVHLVGHSYGGFVGIVAALHRRAKIASLSLVEPVAFGVLHGRDDDADTLASMRSMPFGAAVMPHEPDAAERWLTWFVDFWNGPGAFAALPERMRGSVLATVDVCYGEVVSLLSDRTPANVWATIEARSLLIRGELSPAPARRVASILAETLPKGSLQDIAGAGHMSPLTHADDVAARIATHIDAPDV